MPCTINVGSCFLVIKQNGGQRASIYYVDYWTTSVTLVGGDNTAISSITKAAKGRDVTIAGSAGIDIISIED